MEHDGWAGPHGQNIGVLVALLALMAAPLAMPATATASPYSAATGVTAASAAPSAETPDTALRTSGMLAATAIGTAALVGLWWYLVVRSRRK